MCGVYAEGTVRYKPWGSTHVTVCVVHVWMCVYTRMYVRWVSLCGRPCAPGAVGPPLYKFVRRMCVDVDVQLNVCAVCVSFCGMHRAS